MKLYLKLMNGELLIINAILLTLFMIILDHLFILNHISPFESLEYEYIDNSEVNEIKKKLNSDLNKKHKHKHKRKKNINIETNKCPNEQLINEYNYSWVHISYDAKNLKKQCLVIK